MVNARTVQLALLFGSRLVQTIMRTALGPLIGNICDEMSCGPLTKGSLLSAFSLGYVTTQLAGGVLADKIGSKAVILIATVLAGLLTMASAWAGSVGAMWWAQVLMGAAQGPLFPTSMAYLTGWCPPDERAFASSLLDAGITVGSLVSLPFSGRLAATFGWRATLCVWGVASLAFGALWAALACADPAMCWYMRRAEREYLKSVVPKRAAAAVSATGTKSGGWRESAALLCEPALLAIFGSHCAFNLGVYFVTTWSPTYYKEVLGLAPEALSSVVALSCPPLVNLGVKLFVTRPAEAALRHGRGFSTLRCRRFFSGVGFVGGAAAMLLVQPAAALGGPWLATACFTAAISFAALHPSGFKANYLDAVSPAKAGLVSGFGNTLASCASFAGPLGVSALLSSTGSWTVVFVGIGGTNLAAAALFCTLSTATPLDERRAKSEGCVEGGEGGNPGRGSNIPISRSGGSVMQKDL